MVFVALMLTVCTKPFIRCVFFRSHLPAHKESPTNKTAWLADRRQPNLLTMFGHPVWHISKYKTLRKLKRVHTTTDFDATRSMWIACQMCEHIQIEGTLCRLFSAIVGVVCVCGKSRKKNDSLVFFKRRVSIFVIHIKYKLGIYLYINHFGHTFASILFLSWSDWQIRMNCRLVLCTGPHVPTQNVEQIIQLNFKQCSWSASESIVVTYVRTTTPFLYSHTHSAVFGILNFSRNNNNKTK